MKDIYGAQQVDVESEMRRVLSRRLPLAQVPLLQSEKHELAIISSLFQETPEQIIDYAKHIATELGRSKTQVILTDNTPDGRHTTALSSAQNVLDRSGIHCATSHQPLPGKINGLNTALAQAQAGFIMPIDMNKVADRGALIGLVEEIQTRNLDLLSARVAARTSGNPNQNWNVGSLHIGRRWCFRGFPSIINDDEYTKGVVVGQGGNFGVSATHYVRDTKGRNLTAQQMLIRSARQAIGSLQLSYLTVYDENHEFRPSEFNEPIKPPYNSRGEMIKGTLYQFAKLAPFEMRSVLKQRVGAAIYKAHHPDSYEVAYQKFLQQLMANPAMCAW